MKIIADLVDTIEEELEGAKDYSEKYLELKAENNPFASKFKGLADDELRHAMVIHEYAASKIDELSRVYTPPVEMQETWDKAHKKYIEKVAWIRQILSM